MLRSTGLKQIRKLLWTRNCPARYPGLRCIRTSSKFNFIGTNPPNPRDNDGPLNKSVDLVSKLSRRSIVKTVGRFDQKYATTYQEKIFKFSRKMTKGFWRWWACITTFKNVTWYKTYSGPQTYREQCDFNLVLDSMRGLPVIGCMFIPGGFVILGTALWLFPTWFVLPRTFWSRYDIQQFVKRQFEERNAAVPTIRTFLDSNVFDVEILSGSESVRFKKFQDGTPVNLDTIPYAVLRALASGHGFYLSTKMPIAYVLKLRLRRYTRMIAKQDLMLKNECLVHYLTQRELDWACYRRGYFPQKMMLDSDDETRSFAQTRQAQEKFLLEWIRHSVTLDPEENATDLLFSLMLSETLPKNVKKLSIEQNSSNRVKH